MKQNQQTGQGGAEQLSPLDHAVLDIIGRESVQIKGLGLPDDSPQIGPTAEAQNNQSTAVCIPGNNQKKKLIESNHTLL